jgi:hypothetical protein
MFRIVNVFLMWIELFVDFYDDKSLLDKFIAFLKTDVSNINKEHTTKLAEALKNQVFTKISPSLSFKQKHSIFVTY